MPKLGLTRPRRHEVAAGRPDAHIISATVPGPIRRPIPVAASAPTPVFAPPLPSLSSTAPPALSPPARPTGGWENRPTQLSKDAKRKMKQQAFLSRLQAQYEADDAEEAQLAASSLGNFRSFSEILPTAEQLQAEIRQAAAKAEAGPPVLSQAQRSVLASKEKQRLTAVLAHPAYRQSPFATLQEHLRNETALRRAAEAQSQAQVEAEAEAGKVAKERPLRRGGAHGGRARR